MLPWISFISSVLLLGPLAVNAADANFEDTRCRCVCPSTRYFASSENATDDQQTRRYYTMTNISPSRCNSQNVVKEAVVTIIDEQHLDAFLANCDCRHESRNTVMLKVVVIFVICVIAVLIAYMLFLMVLNPMLRKQRFVIPYRQQNDEMEDNIFARVVESTSGGSVLSSDQETPSGVMRARTSSNVLGRVEAEQSRWMKKVEEQRKNIFQDHSMLN